MSSEQYVYQRLPLSENLEVLTIDDSDSEAAETTMGAPNDSEIVAAEHGHPTPQTAELARRVVRKIDCRILLIMFITYNLNFMDKTILSSAAIFGLEDDNHLHGNQYSWVSSIFYFGYVLSLVFLSLLTGVQVPFLGISSIFPCPEATHWNLSLFGDIHLGCRSRCNSCVFKLRRLDDL
jgi:hypothetical protein